MSTPKPHGVSEHTRRRERFVRLVLPVIVVWLAGTAKALPPADPTEYNVKAAFVFNFAQYVEWPAESFPTGDSAMVFCTYGSDPFEGSLVTIIERGAGDDRPASFRIVYSPATARACHLLFVPRDRAAETNTLAHSLRGSHTLLIGEDADFLESGGVIRLFIEERKVRFGINMDAAREQGLRVSSQLLKLARRLIDSERGSVR